MNTRDTNIQNTFITMCEFDGANAADYAHLPDAAAQFTAMRATITALKTFEAAQISGERSRAVQKKSLIVAAIKRKLKNIARIARGLNFDDEGFQRLFAMPHGNSETKLLAYTREAVAQAATHEDAFLGRGARLTFIADLRGDIADYERLTSEKVNAHREKTSASVGIDEQIENGLQAAEIVDSIMQSVYEDDPVKLSEWLKARHVKRSPKTDKKPEEKQ